MSGGFISLIGFAQDQKYKSKNFSVATFFLLSSLIMVLSTIAFTIIQFSRRGKLERLSSNNNNTTSSINESDKRQEEEAGGDTNEYTPIENHDETNNYHTNNQHTPLNNNNDSNSNSNSNSNISNNSIDLIFSSSPSSPVDQSPLLPLPGNPNGKDNSNDTLQLLLSILIPLLVQFTANFVENGMIPSLTTYAFLNYEEGKRIMSLSINISLLVSPLSCLLAVFFRCPSKLLLLSAGYLLPSAYILIAALMSPTPFFHSSSFGAWLMMLMYIIKSGFIAYTKTMVYYRIKSITSTTNSSSASYRGFAWSGFITQCGSGIGSILFFLLVNTTHLFYQPPEKY